MALTKALTMLAPLEPEKSNDPETLGLSGAIHKRLWEYNNDRVKLDQAIHFYSKGFELRGDYYNGQNAAFCFETRSVLQDAEDEALFDRMSALKIRNSIVESLPATIADDDFEEREDQHWIYATLAICYFALGSKEDASKYESLFLEKETAEWQRKTYLEGKNKVIEIHQALKGKD